MKILKQTVNDLLKKYKKGIKKDYLNKTDQGLVEAYLEEFVDDLLGEK